MGAQLLWVFDTLSSAYSLKIIFFVNEYLQILCRCSNCTDVRNLRDFERVVAVVID